MEVLVFILCVQNPVVNGVLCTTYSLVDLIYIYIYKTLDDYA